MTYYDCPGGSLPSSLIMSSYYADYTFKIINFDIGIGALYAIVIDQFLTYVHVWSIIYGSTNCEGWVAISVLHTKRGIIQVIDRL